MPEIVWKQGAESDLLRIFKELEDFLPGSGERFTWKLDAVLQTLKTHPSLAPVFESPMRRLVIGTTGYGLFYTGESSSTRLFISASIPIEFAKKFAVNLACEQRNR